MSRGVSTHPAWACTRHGRVHKARRDPALALPSRDAANRRCLGKPSLHPPLELWTHVSMICYPHVILTSQRVHLNAIRVAFHAVDVTDNQLIIYCAWSFLFRISTRPKQITHSLTYQIYKDRHDPLQPIHVRAILVGRSIA